MGMKQRIIISVLLLLFCTVHRLAALNGAEFLNVSVNPVLTGCGVTIAGDGSDATGRINPALLITGNDSVVSLAARPWLSDTLFYSASITSPLSTNNNAVIKISLHSFTSMPVRIYDLDGTVLGEENLNDFDFGFDLGLKLPTAGFSAGGGVHAVYRVIPEGNQYTLYLNGGIAWKGSFLSFDNSYHTNTVVSLSIRHLGPALISRQTSERSRLPLTLTSALRYAFYSNIQGELAVSTVWNWNLHDRSHTFAAGFNWRLLRVFTLRTGYKIGRELENFSFGFGTVIPLGRFSLSLDYAFTPLREAMNAIHSLSVSSYF